MFEAAGNGFSIQQGSYCHESALTTGPSRTRWRDQHLLGIVDDPIRSSVTRLRNSRVFTQITEAVFWRFAMPEKQLLAVTLREEAKSSFAVFSCPTEWTF
jgi:hypothetical protein